MQSLIPKNYKKSIKYTNILINSIIPNDDLIDNFRNQGIFRISKYNFKEKVVKKILILFSMTNNLNEYNSKYLKNIKNFHLINSDVYNEYNIIVNNIKDSKFLFKKLLAEADQEFYEKTFGLIENPEIYFSQSQDIPVESLLEYISYLIYCIKEVQSSEFISESFINESYSSTSALLVIKSIQKILIYKDFEIKIDFFDFDVFVEDNNLTIKNTNIDRAISWGYAK